MTRNPRPVGNRGGRPIVYLQLEGESPIGIDPDSEDDESTFDDLLARKVDTHSGGNEEVDVVASSGATLSLDLANGNGQWIVLDDDCEFAFSAVTSGKLCSFTLILEQDATGGRTVTWPASVFWPDDIEPVLSTDPGAVDTLAFLTKDGGTVWLGRFAGAGSAVGELDDLTDVTIASPAEGHLLRYNGSAWVNVTPSSIGLVGPILVSDTPAGSPLVFDDLLQNDDGDDLLYADL